jgi:hypothetical protein
LRGGIDAAFEGRRTLVAVNQDTGLAEVGLAAIVEGFVGVAELRKVVCSFGSLRIG